MSMLIPTTIILHLLLLLLLTFTDPALSSLYQPPPTILTYHGGQLLEGHIPISILWYGTFSPRQKSIISDFVLSLTPPRDHQPPNNSPSVARWWETVDYYVQKAGKKKTHILLTNQVDDESYSMGRLLTRAQVSDLADRLGVMRGGVAVVLTSADVAVQGFCTSACGLHSSTSSSRRAARVWVGDAARQCPGKCSWPFHAADYYGPRGGVALGAPNGDAGSDGMVVNLATLFAGAVTNPYGDGYFEGVAGGHVEVAGACPGVFGKGAYPGYAGDLRVDPVSGGSYNAEGRNGRKYLVPVLLDPIRHSCSVVA
ncbi:protein PHOSPHATE-INDUCED 1-like [Typha latifolia]|uniref:protein PHOSPHATE-INDUCED 1-like n=1 Tax=Typha latifolia TaxID=4733 RepID=UPI003C308129